MLNIDYTVVTYGAEGLRRVEKMLLPPAPGVRYVVSWQNAPDIDIPPRLSLPDVLLVKTDSRGISRNRNNALDYCTADIVVFADDDLILYPDAPENIRNTYAAYPDADIITFISEGSGDNTRFPKTGVKFGNKFRRKFPKGYGVRSIEITMRRRAAETLRCCPDLGIGSPTIHAGEDEMIVLTALRRGMNGRFQPIAICSHPHPSTGEKSGFTPDNLMGFGCVIALSYPWTALLRIPLKAWRCRKSATGGFLSALWHITRGALAAPGIYLKNRYFLAPRNFSYQSRRT
ncbi:MAG: glycosyltransferase [Muribaculaceae bacterium]|nr:glycosyltransferase [Muribaculaceae bacterium]